MITIEFESPEVERCSCCNEVITRLTRFVYQDHDAFAYYYALLEQHANPKVAMCLVVLLEWGEKNDEIIGKTGFPLRIWQGESGFNAMLLDASESPWKDIQNVQILNRNESLQHPQKSDVFHIVDHMVGEDQEIVAYFKA